MADTALLLDVMCGPDARDRTCLPAPPVRYVDALRSTDLTGIRVGWSVDLGFAVVDPAVAGVCHPAATALATAIDAELVDLELRLEDYIGLYSRIEGVDKFVGVDRELWERRLDELDPLVAPGWPSAARATLPKLAAIEDGRRRLVDQVAAIFGTVDLLVTPMSARAAFAAEGPMPDEIAGRPAHRGMAVIHAMLANLVNLPAISLPAGLVDGLPIGLQVVAPRHREDLLLSVAARYEASHPWPRHCPGG